ncbi:MAG: hypothetical protein VBE63_21450 [Lamprobacter sp.]|uniref:hypothetical protein n=1 Tax=Lamprobacter sp. TaxID=3100796 RepID=UPI002B25B648|nr:hypothetical protein [Lamprobacter sp.]MEA3642487.1 hypothetical protein [Lamprobacter sp.]
MLKFSAAQMSHLTRTSFFERLYRFIEDNALREDWKTWMRDHRHLEQIWNPVWPAAQEHTEHDCALFLILLAIRSFESDPVDNPHALLIQVASSEVSLKSYIADRGYLAFSAFDYPTGSLYDRRLDV